MQALLPLVWMLNSAALSQRQAVALLTTRLRADLGVMITASHNGFSDNGIKLFGPDGRKLSDEAELAIEALMREGWKKGLAINEKLGRVRRYEDFQARYIEIAKRTFPMV